VTEPPAKFFVNSGLVSSPTDIYHLLRPLIKQTVAYRYLRAGSVISHGHLVFGAVGFTLEFPMQRYSRRAKALGSFVDGWIDQRTGCAA